MRHADEGEVVVPADIGAALEVVEAEGVFEFAVVLLDAPAQFGQFGEPMDRSVGRKVGRPDVHRGVLAGGPLGQQPTHGQLTVERHGTRTLAGIRERILQRFLCLAACISLNHHMGRPSRALVDYVA